jgi:hypothetical protein
MEALAPPSKTQNVLYSSHLPFNVIFSALPLAPCHFLHVQREIDCAHDAVAEHFIGLIAQRIAVDSMISTTDI